MSNKSELIEKIVDLLMTEFEPFTVSATDRTFLENSTVSFLESKLRELQKDAVANLRKKHADSMEESEERVLRAQAERSADHALHQRRMQQATEPQRTRQLAQDRQTFANAAKTLQTFAVNEANFSLVRQAIGEGFSLYAIQQMLAANGATLSPPTQEELNEWASQSIENHNDALLKMDPDQLRAKVRQEATDSRVAKAKAEADSQLAASKARDAVMGFPSLPETWQGQKLDAAFIKNCSVETQKLLSRRFGPAQLTARLRGQA